MLRNIELCYMTLLNCGPLERIRVAAEAGYDRVGLRLVPTSADEQIEPILTDITLRRQIVSALGDAGISAGGIEFVRLAADTDIAALEPLFACAAELGAKQLLTLGGDVEPERLTDLFRALCDAAAPYELAPQLEFALWTRVPDLAAARAVVEGGGRSEGGVLIDALHVHRCGVTLDEVRATPSNRIYSLQLCDAMKTYDHDWDAMKILARKSRLPPGQGQLDLIELIRAVPAHAIISVEVPNEVLQAQLGAKRHARLVLEATRRVLQSADAIL
jgi:sugar phosphate isomerase/epimerase